MRSCQDEADHKLDQLFERRSAQPWTDRALTAAAGPAAMLPPKAPSFCVTQTSVTETVEDTIWCHIV
eukprot:2356699-Amphidinium_carterae.1